MQVSINGFKELVKFIESPEIQSLQGSHYVIPKRLSQDLVESFFSVQRQSCGGTNNMTAIAYGYNVNSAISYSATKLLRKKQTNASENDEIELSIEQESNTSLPRRGNMESIFTKNMWPVYL